MTFSALFTTITSAIGQAIVNVWNIVKIVILVLLSYVFMVSVKTFLDLLLNVVTTSVIGEVFSLTSMFLPFNASVVFGSISAVISAIITFFVARKVYNLYKELFAAA